MKVYLITSESYKIVDEEVRKITSKFNNVVKYDLRINSIAEVINEANYFSLLNEEKLIIVKSNDLFRTVKKDEEVKDNNNDKLLEEYFNNPNNSSTIVFTSNIDPDGRKKIFKIIKEKGIVISYKTLNKKELCYKCMTLLKEKKYSASYEIANYIVENSYANYDIMTNELEKIFSLIKPKELTLLEIKKIVSISILGNTYNYINAIIDMDLEKALIASKNFETLKIEPIMVIISLYKEFQILYYVKAKENLNEIKNKYRKEDWQIQKYIENSRLYKLNDIKKIINILNDFDFKYKSGQIDRTIILDLLSLELCS